MSLVRYESKDGVLSRKLFPVGAYKESESQYEDIITLDYKRLQPDKVAVCLGMARCGSTILIARFEDFAHEIASKIIAEGLCNTFDDITFCYIWGVQNNMEINRVIFNDGHAANFRAENEIFAFSHSENEKAAMEFCR